MKIPIIPSGRKGNLDMSGELELNLTMSPTTGPGSHKPRQGRGGVPLPDSYYFPEGDLKVKEKKGIGIGEKVRSEKANNPSWSDIF